MESKLKKLNYVMMIFIVWMLPIFFVKKIFEVYFSWNLIEGVEYYHILWALSPILLFIYLYNVVKKKIKLGIFDYLFFLLAVLNLIVCVFAINTRVSIWGNPFRHEGLISILVYYLIFLNAKMLNDEKKIKNILNNLIIVGLIQFVYCFIQIFYKQILLPEFIFKGSSNMACGLLKNPNFLGSYIIILLGIVVMNFLIQEKNTKIYLFLSIIFFINLLFTQSTGPFLAFLCMIIFALAFIIIKKKVLWKRFLLLFICLTLTYFITDYAINVKNSNNSENIESYTINYDLKQLFRALTGKMKIYDWPQEEVNVEQKENIENVVVELENDVKKEIISETNVNEEIVPVKDEDNLNGLGSGRISIWRHALKLVPRYFLFGCGIDNFGFAYKWHWDGIFYDKAHNDYLQILITQGIYVFVTYMAILVWLFIKGIKSNNKLVWVLLLSFVGYCVQSFTNISVVECAPYFYMICGLLAALVQKEKVE